MYFGSSRDLFFFVLAIGTAVLTVLFAWLLWYIISIIRQAHHVMEEFTESLEKLHTILDSIKETVSASTSQFSLIAGTVKQLVSFYKRRHGGDDASEEDDDGAEEDKRKKRKR